MSTRIKTKRSVGLVTSVGLLVGCTSTTPPPFAASNPADPSVPVSVHAPRNVLGQNETSLAIQAELSRTEREAKGFESMQSMGQGEMPGMQHDGMNMGAHKPVPDAGKVEQEKKALAKEMKQTSEEMEKTSEQLKERAGQPKAQDFYYTCVMHPEIHQDQPGNCPKCGMTLLKKEGAPPK